MAKIAIVMKSDDSIATWYDADAPKQAEYGGPWGRRSESEHVELADGIDQETVKAVLKAEKWTKDGEPDATEAPLDWQIEGWTHHPEHYELEVDSAMQTAKTQKDRDMKLAELRRQRAERLEEADSERKKHEDSDSNAVGTGAAWSTYRIALRDLTDSYKDSETAGSAALDGYAMDMSDFDAWPVKPS